MTASQNDGSSRLREGRVDPMKRKPLVRAMDRHKDAIFTPRRYAPPAGIGGMIQSFFKRFQKPVVITSEQEIAHGLDMVRLKSPTQLAGTLGRVLMAKKTLETTRQVDLPFPTDILAGTGALDGTQREVLLSYGAALKVFRAKCEHGDTPITQAVHGGLEIWIALLEAAGHEQLDAAREIWGSMEQGRGQVAGALEFMLRRPVTDVEKEYLDYAPMLFQR